MDNNNPAAESASKSDPLRHLASELRETYRLLHVLCSQLEGGGIVRAGDIEPTVLKAVPKLRHALAVLDEVTTIDEADPDRDDSTGHKLASKNPLLI